MGRKADAEDYKKFIISKWSNLNLESFKRPDINDLEKQSRYYEWILKRYIPFDKDIEVLEIGCGYGYLIYTLKRLGYSHIEAIDIIPECCSFVEENFGINVHCLDVIDFSERAKKNITL